MTRTKFLPFLIGASLLLTAGTDAAAGASRYQRTLEHYTLPDITLINQNHQPVSLRGLLAEDRPLMIDFIYGTCNTICPVLSAGFSGLQRKLGERSGDVRLVSITIDPEHDTPALMADYLQRYRARPGWDVLTGSREEIDQVLYAFEAYVPNKMNHFPLTIMRSPGSDEWVRIYGLIGIRDLMAEYQLLKGEQ